jgi:hypothetical protein
MHARIKAPLFVSRVIVCSVKEHLSDNTAGRAHVFIPVNLTGFAPNRPRLAVVDASWIAERKGDAMHLKLWKTTACGTVSRQFTDGPGRDELGRQFRQTEQLAHVILRLPPFSPTYAFNGDPLDCRRENLRLAQHLPAAREHAVSYKPGSVVSTLEGHNEALNELRSFPEFYIGVAARRRAARLTREQVLHILNETLSGALQGLTAESITGYISEEMHVNMHAQQTRMLLAGATLRQPDFDYARLRASRPSPRERALERWKLRNT